jgi:hypothetical protein
MLSAVYVFQNAGDIYVTFLIFERRFPQGVWEVILFSSGVILMWIFSIFASIEANMRHRSKMKEKEERIARLEEEKKSLLSAFNNISQATEQRGVVPSDPQPAQPETPAADDVAGHSEKGTVSA